MVECVRVHHKGVEGSLLKIVNVRYSPHAWSNKELPTYWDTRVSWWTLSMHRCL